MEGPKEVLKKVLVTGASAVWLLCGPLIGSAMAQTADANPVNSGDTAWMLISSALVLLMTPGLAFFYGGLVRSRNVLNTMMMSLILMALVGVTWTLWGYSLAFDVDKANLNASGFAQGLEQFI
jgi:Amt family ammonium transporter